MKYDKGCVAIYVWPVQGGNYNIFKGPNAVSCLVSSNNIMRSYVAG